MHFRDLRTGDCFQFSIAQTAMYEYRGDGWYGWPYSGGPWHRRDNPSVVLVTRPVTTLPLEQALEQYKIGASTAASR